MRNNKMYKKYYEKTINGHYIRMIDTLLFNNIRKKNIIRRGKKIIKKLSDNSNYQVLDGVFKGLQYHSLDITESALVPKIIGSYEYQLQPLFNKIIQTKYTDIIDVGSAEGYYAVGLAKKMPKTTIHCFDINEKDIEFSKQMAKINNVTNMTWNAFCDEKTLITFPYRGKTLIISDCEGYELELFTKTVIDKCRHADFLIELHDICNPVISGEILSRFQYTHNFSIVNNKDVDYSQLKILEKMTQSERDFALCEHRGGIYRNIYMEWVFLTSKTNK